MAAVQAAGGKVLGAVRAPLGTADFSSLPDAGAGVRRQGDRLRQCRHRPAELHQAGRRVRPDRRAASRMATLLMAINDVNSLGQKTCEGLVYTDSFYWDMTDKTRAWSKRWGAKMGGMVPGLLHAGNYCAANALAEGGEGGRHHRRRRGGGEDEGHAGQRFLQHQREDPRGRAGDARDVSVAGEAGGRGEIEVRLLQASWRRSRRTRPGARWPKAAARW